MSSFLVRVPQRWGDLDAQGHVNNGTVIDYLQEARVDFFIAGGHSGMLDSGVVVVSHQVEYLAPIEFTGEPLDCELGIIDLGGSRFTVGYTLSHGGELKARARTVLCPVELATMKPRRLAPAERDWFEQHRIDSPDYRPVATTALLARGHITEIRPRWSDVDRYDHVNNVRVFDYVQEARIAMTTQASSTTARAVPGATVLWLVVRQDVDYRGALHFRIEPYHAHTAVVAVGRTSLTLNTEIVDPANPSVVICAARTVLVQASHQGVAEPLTPSQRDDLTAWAVE